MRCKCYFLNYNIYNFSKNHMFIDKIYTIPMIVYFVYSLILFFIPLLWSVIFYFGLVYFYTYFTLSFGLGMVNLAWACSTRSGHGRTFETQSKSRRAGKLTTLRPMKSTQRWTNARKIKNLMIRPPRGG